MITHKNLFILSSFWMMLLMGTVYSYSIIRVDIETLYQLSTFQSGLPYMFSLVFYALFMMVTGRLLKPNRVRLFAITGTFSIIIGYIISFIASNLFMLILGYGIFIGSGVGMVYGIPLYLIQSSSFKRKGFMIGLILLGFGMSPLVTAPFVKFLLTLFELKEVFLIFAVVFLSTQLPLTFIYRPGEIVEDDSKTSNHKWFDQKIVYLYLIFMLITSIGLMMIGLSYQLGVTYYSFDETMITLSISIFALLNGLSRPIFGYLTDQFGIFKSAMISFFLIILAAILSLINQGESMVLFILSYGLFWFNLGAWLSMMPQVIRIFYDKKIYAKLYGILFTSYGIGAILSNLLSGTIIDIFKSTNYIYLSIMMIVLISYGLLLKLKYIYKKEIL